MESLFLKGIFFSSPSRRTKSPVSLEALNLPPKEPLKSAQKELMAFKSPFVAGSLGFCPPSPGSPPSSIWGREVCTGQGAGGHASPRPLSLSGHVSVSKGLSNLTTFIVRLPPLDGVAPSPKGFAISRYSSLNVSDSSLASFPGAG